MKKIILIVLFLFPSIVCAAGVEASPSKLDIIASDSSGSTELSVRNPSANVQLFEVYADEFTENIKILPTCFILEAGASEKISIVYNTKSNTDAIFKTNISVVAKPMTDSTFQFNSGIKIPITITVGGESLVFPWWYYGIVAAVVIVGASIFYLRKKKRTIISPL